MHTFMCVCVCMCVHKWVIAVLVVIGCVSRGVWRNWLGSPLQQIEEQIHRDLGAARNPGKPQQGPSRTERERGEKGGEGWRGGGVKWGSE